VNLKSRTKLFQVGTVIEWSGCIGVLTEATNTNKGIIFSIKWISTTNLELNERLHTNMTLWEMQHSINLAPEFYQVLYGY